LVNTWLVADGRTWTVETSALREIDGETRLTMTLAFRDSGGRVHMAKA